MSDRPSLQELSKIQQHLGIRSSALVERDWHSIKALASIAALDTSALRLVFGGGTALSRAYRVVPRLSEDIDLRIVAADTPEYPELRRMRDDLTNALLDAGFKFDPTNTAHRELRHEDTHTVYRIPYEPLAEPYGALRPEIQIETSVLPLRRPAIERAVISLVAEGFCRPAELACIACVSISEIAAEKLVGLTRHAGAELTGGEGHHPTLVRHLYDLCAIQDHYDPADVGGLAREIMVVEAQTRAQHLPTYRADVLAATLKAIKGIASHAGFAADYENFLREMVYSEGPDFETAVATLNMLAQHLVRADA